MGSVLVEFLEIMVAGISTLATGIAGGVITFVKALFFEVDSTTGAVSGLGIVGGTIGLFAGIALAVRLTSKVYMWLTSLGAR